MQSREDLLNEIDALRNRVAELERGQDVLCERERLLSDIINFLPDATFAVDKSRRIIIWNRAIEEMTGVLAEDMIGKGEEVFTVPFYGAPRSSLANRLWGSDHAAASAYSVMKEEGDNLVGETFCPALYDGKGTHVWAKTAPLHNNDGFMVGAIESIRDITVQKHLEESLIRSEKRYRDLVDNSPVGVYQTHLDGRILFANHAFTAMLGYGSSDQLLNTNVDTLYKNRKDRTIFLKKLKKASSLNDYELDMLSKNGDIRHILLSAALDDDLISGTIIDITKRKTTEESLRESERRLFAIINFLPDATFVIDTDGKVLAWNHAMETMTGVKAETMLGKGDYEYAIPFYDKRKPLLVDALSMLQVEQEKVLKEYQHIKRQDESLIGETYVTNFPIGKRYLVGTAAALRDTKGSIFGTIESFKDITERKHLEEKLTAEHDQLVSILDAIPIPSIVIDRSGNVILWNRSSEIYFNKKRDEVLGKKQDMSYLYSGKTPPTLAEIVLEMSDTEILQKYGDRGIHKSIAFPRAFARVGTFWNLGEERTVSLQAARIYDPRGEVIGAVQTSLDITEQVRASEEKEKLQAQLFKSQKMEAIGTLAGGVAHDFNNILMGIQGYTGLALLDMKPGHPNYTRLKSIEYLVTSGSSLTHQLLGFAQGGKYEVKPTNINELVEKSSTLFGRTNKEVIFERYLQEDVWVVDVDQGQIEQVLLNLFINAWQAMPEGGNLHLETRNKVLGEVAVKPHGVSPGKYVRISVTDTGIGMDEKTMAQIFDPFFTTKKPGRGTGLGLASAYGIIKNHEGFVTVQSELGKGATFNIFLPASEKLEAVSATTVSSCEVLHGCETILVVDDEKSIVAVLKEILENMGYRIMIAGSGQEAISIYMEKHEEIDLIILDMIMPGMSGEKTFETLKILNPAVEVVLASGYSLDDQTRCIMERGCKGFIQKPFRMHEISRKIRDVLDKKG
jgi:two-component system cell cycle sensor histidine kinase/response regulator CckA